MGDAEPRLETAMQTLTISYVKRYRMEIALAGLPPPVWPEGFRPAAWRVDLLDAHARTLCDCFHGGIDALVFPSLGHLDGCRSLMGEIARRHAFIPEATWLALGPEGPCGTIQALRERGVRGAIQNIGIVPACRGRGLGQALLLQALHGMYDAGLGRAILEVTATNDAAVRLYHRLGFSRTKVLYKAIPASTSPPGGEARPYLYV